MLVTLTVVAVNALIGGGLVGFVIAAVIAIALSFVSYFNSDKVALDENGAPVAVLSLREVVAFIVTLLPKRVMNLPPEPHLAAHSEDGG